MSWAIRTGRREEGTLLRARINDSRGGGKRINVKKKKEAEGLG